MRISLEPDKLYHIYHQANGNEKLFYTEDNYYYFLKRFGDILAPVVDTFAYCLLPNHFHWLIKIKSEKEIFDYLRTNEKIPDDISLIEFKSIKITLPNQNDNIFSIHLSKLFSNFFSAYNQEINKQNNRKGNLLIQNFGRKEIQDNYQAQEIVMYIHANPVHHKFVGHINDWKFSSYKAHLSDKPTMLKRVEVINLFETKENYIDCHENKIEKIMGLQFEEEFL